MGEEKREVRYQKEESLLKELRGCLKSMKGRSFSEGIEQALDSLKRYFQAEAVVLAYQRDECFQVMEVHEDSAADWMKTVMETVKAGNLTEVVSSGRWKLVESLQEGLQSLGYLLVLNPRANETQSELLSLVGEYMTARILRQSAMEQLEYETTHDHLTNLWNRNSFVLWTQQNGEDSYASLGIITVDIIHLAELNEQFGYFYGSKKLVEMAKFLKAEFDGYRIFRYDEDEMLIFLPDIQKDTFGERIEEFKKKVAGLPFAVSMGFSWSANVNFHDQIAESEMIMENDKRAILHGMTVMQRLEQGVIDEVQDLLDRGQYLVYLQPKVDIHKAITKGAEALIRQIDKELGIVGPGMFIPVLERYNLVHMVDLFVLEEIFKYQKREIEAGHRTIPISVNFSKKTIMYPDLITKVKRMTEEYRIPEELIHIEITETVGDMDHMLVEDVANQLKALGFCLSMDDFGSHYSNLAVLIQYDFDSAKIDRSMVTEITKNPKSRVVLDYMTSMINDLGIHCIVEGIETKEQVEILKNTKAEMIQGYFFGKPVPHEEFYGTYMLAELPQEKA